MGSSWPVFETATCETLKEKACIPGKIISAYRLVLFQRSQILEFPRV